MLLRVLKLVEIVRKQLTVEINMIIKINGHESYR